jgi:hypothetical protein
MRTIKALWIPCLILTALLVLCFATYFIVPTSSDWLRDLSLSLATEIVGILLTILLIDRVLRANEELKAKEEKRKYQAIAFRHLHTPLVTYLRMFVSLP